MFKTYVLMWSNFGTLTFNGLDFSM